MPSQSMQEFLKLGVSLTHLSHECHCSILPVIFFHILHLWEKIVRQEENLRKFKRVGANALPFLAMTSL